MISKNMAAFLTMIAVSEGTQHLGDRGYNVNVGGGLFGSYADHPRRAIFIRGIGKYSTAAGRYQILSRYYDAYKKQLNLPDFSPDSQDKIAMQLIRECMATNDVNAGRFANAVHKCRSRWASFPGANYSQREHPMSKLQIAYVAAGGVVV